jgi:hypothetical protein
MLDPNLSLETAKSELDICLDGWKKYRETLIEQKLDLDKQIEKTVFSISSGALGISLAFLDKISPASKYPWVYFFLGLGWAGLVLSLILQSLSFYRTSKKITKSISQVEEIVETESLEDAMKKEDEYYINWKVYNTKINKENNISYYSMIGGIFFILLFAFISLFIKEEKKSETIIINLPDSTFKNSTIMATSKDNKSSNLPQKPVEQGNKQENKTFSEKQRGEGKVDTNKLTRQIVNPPIKTKPKGQ